MSPIIKYSNGDITIEKLLNMLRCPATGQRLVYKGEELVSVSGGHRYLIEDGVPDLRKPPASLHISVPWYDPWDDLDAMSFSFPEPLDAPDLPYHFDRHQASVTGPEGKGRWLLEVGCGTRHCEPYFAKRGFNYVGTDVDKRGQGPHLMADGHNLPFVDGVFDFCYSMSTYEHLICPLVAAREAFRVLKPGGKIFGSAAFVYGFHDRASFFHMTHAGLLCILRSAGFEDVKIWPGWPYYVSVPAMAFTGKFSGLWKLVARGVLAIEDLTFTRIANMIRRVVGKEPIDLLKRRVRTAGGLNFVAIKPESDA